MIRMLRILLGELKYDISFIGSLFFVFLWVNGPVGLFPANPPFNGLQNPHALLMYGGYFLGFWVCCLFVYFQLSYLKSGFSGETQLYSYTGSKREGNLKTTYFDVETVKDPYRVLKITLFRMLYAFQLPVFLMILLGNSYTPFVFWSGFLFIIASIFASRKSQMSSGTRYLTSLHQWFSAIYLLLFLAEVLFPNMWGRMFSVLKMDVLSSVTNLKLVIEWIYMLLLIVPAIFALLSAVKERSLPSCLYSGLVLAVALPDVILGELPFVHFSLMGTVSRMIATKIPSGSLFLFQTLIYLLTAGLVLAVVLKGSRKHLKA